MAVVTASARVLGAMLLAATLTACAPTYHATQNADVSMTRPREQTAAPGLAVTQAFVATTPSRVSRSNAEIAQDFLDLEFRMESGRALPYLQRLQALVGRHGRPWRPTVDFGAVRAEGDIDPL